MARNPRRTGSTAAALMIGIALVTTTLVVGESVSSAFSGHAPRGDQGRHCCRFGWYRPVRRCVAPGDVGGPGCCALVVPLERTRADLVSAAAGWEWRRVTSTSSQGGGSG